MLFERVDTELRSWWESLTQEQRDLLREHSYDPVLPESVAAILDTCPGWVSDGDAGWWPSSLRWLVHEDDPELG